jgi:hypothetical protein
VEQRSDVRKSGMEGFYANLLTKNIAMGGDVSAHAVSVHTAGSARHAHLLHSDEPVSSATAAAAAADASANQVRAGDPTAATFSASTGESGPSGGARDGSHDISSQPEPSMHTHGDRSDTEDPQVQVPQQQQVGAPSASASKTPTQPGVDKKEVILSAKDRYLARKRALENPSDS